MFMGEFLQTLKFFGNFTLQRYTHLFLQRNILSFNHLKKQKNHS